MKRRSSSVTSLKKGLGSAAGKMLKDSRKASNFLLEQDEEEEEEYSVTTSVTLIRGLGFLSGYFLSKKHKMYFSF